MTLHRSFQSKMADGAEFLNGDHLEASFAFLEADKEMDEEFINFAKNRIMSLLDFSGSESHAWSLSPSEKALKEFMAIWDGVPLVESGTHVKQADFGLSRKIEPDIRKRKLSEEQNSSKPRSGTSASAKDDNNDDDHGVNRAHWDAVLPPVPQRTVNVQYHIDDFNLLKVLGEGGFSKVLLCELRETKQVYAIKALKKDVVLEDDDVERTMVERRVLALATRHLFLTHLHSAFQSQDHLFFVMEYQIGGDLSFHIQRVGKFDEIRARFYAAEIVCGLEFLHDRGIIYRDLKLDNVLLDADGHIKLADFGMCKEGIVETKKASTFCGTDDYIAPEILLRRQYDDAADWWSFGVLLYKMLTGEFPFEGDGREELFYSICGDEVHYPEEISSNAEDCLCQLFQRTPVKRLGYKKGQKPNIRGHKFFDRLDWTKLEQRKIQPPFKPEVTSDRDTKNFDPDFTREVPQFTPTDKDLLQSIDQGQFKGFSFVNSYFGSQQ